VLATAGGLALVAAVTALLTLDTAVAFCTPVLVLAAREAGQDERPLLYGTVLMANGASLLLPGANLTNLLLLERLGDPPTALTGQLAVAGVAAALATAASVLLTHRRLLRRASAHPRPATAGPAQRLDRRGRVTVAVAALAAAAIALLPEPALPVLALGLGLAAARALLPAAVRAIGPVSLLGLLALAVAVGTVGRAWTVPADTVGQATGLAATGGAALTAVALNNLPATALLTAVPPADPVALLVGLGVGANLAVTGSLSALLWWRAALAVGARPSAARFSAHGAVAAVVAGTAAVLAAGAWH
jgi:arsenical pump membrane protein